MTRQIWVVSEGSPGHISMSVGLAAALGELSPVEVSRIECRPKLNGAARSLVRAWMGSTGRALPDWVCRRWLRMGVPPAGRPDLIVCSGGKSVFAARTLAARHGAPCVYLGERKPYPAAWFHTVFTPSDLEHDRTDIRIEMIPTQVSRDGVERAARAWADKPRGRLWSCVIGGCSASHRYESADWRLLGEMMNRLAKRNGIRWLVTTSRRTGADAEALLRGVLSPEAIAFAVWWSDKPAKKMQAMLGAAERVFVTQDSVTMVTESVASGRPTHVLIPAAVKFPADSFMPGYLARLEAARRIARLKLSELDRVDLGAMRLEPRTTRIELEIAGLLRERLAWPAK